MAGTPSTMKGSHHHHALTASVLCREEKSIEQLLTTMESFTNPFTQNSSDLFNLVTKVVMPEKVKNDLCKQSEIGQNLYQRFVKDRIQSGKFNLWSPMKKQKLQTWKTMGKKVKVRADNDIVVLREDRNLFSCPYDGCVQEPTRDRYPGSQEKITEKLLLVLLLKLHLSWDLHHVLGHNHTGLGCRKYSLQLGPYLVSWIEL